MTGADRVIRVIAVLVLLLASPGCTDDGGVVAADELRERLRKSDERERFQFTYKARGSQVIGCFLPNRQFVVMVDASTGTLVVRASPDSDPAMAMARGDEVFLHRSLFSPGALRGAWLRVAGEPTSAETEAIRSSLGAGLASYVLSPGLPASGEAIGRAALDVAITVRRLGTDEVRGATVDGFRVLLDASGLGLNDRSESGRVDQTGYSVDVWVDEQGRVLRVAVQPQPAEDGHAARVPTGWVADYSVLDEQLIVEEPAAVTDLRMIDPARLASPSVERCELAP